MSVLRVFRPEPIRRRARKRAPAAALLLMVLWAMAAASEAGAHAVVQPPASRPAEQQVYTLTIPSERGSDVIEVSMQVPQEVESLLVRKAPGWQVRIQREGDRVAVVRWSGNRIPPRQYDSFQFIARNPVQEGELEWKVIQKYTDATDRWIGPPDSEQPAARVRISESAAPVDAINTEEGTPAGVSAGADAGQTPAASGGGSDGDSNTVPIVLGVVALVAALAALGVALATRRRPG